MRIAVTGGLGSIGVQVLRLLAAADHDLLAVDVFPGPSGTLPPSVVYARANVTDLASLIGAFRGWRPDVVMHLAAILGEINTRAPRTCMESNLMGALNVLEAALLSGVRRVVAASTWRVYDVAATADRPRTTPEDPLYLDEDALVDPLDPYAIAKYGAEKLGAFYRRRYGLEFAAVRFSCYFGPQRAAGGRLRGLAAGLNGVILSALRREPAEVEADPQIPFDAVYVKDCAAGVAAACQAPALPHAAYNIASGIPITLWEVAGAAARIWGEAPVSFRPAAPHDPIVLKIDRAREDLGYVPAFSLPEALADFSAELGKAVRTD